MRAGILTAVMLLLVAGDLSLSLAQALQFQAGEVREIHASAEHAWSLSWSSDGNRTSCNICVVIKGGALVHERR